ncbi:GntR family transcriptional regulator [Bifidobacterium dentium]|uniref:GntR family transcriptional regulator n=1 Tax=Bifidobacterium dentium TaxID=1689 RepID=UPI003BAA3CCF
MATRIIPDSPAEHLVPIIQRIRSLIAEQGLMPGDRIGTERSLAEQFGVVRNKIRDALVYMEAHREIIRWIGRNGGVMVADDRLTRNINTTESLPSIARRQGFVLRSRSLEKGEDFATVRERRTFGLESEYSRVYRTTRLRLLDGGPFSLERTTVPANLFPGFLEQNLSCPFYDLFRKRYGLVPKYVDEVIEPIESNEVQSDLLNVMAGTPLIKIHRITQDEHGVTFEEGEDYYLAARIRFDNHHPGCVRRSSTTIHNQ